MTNRQQRYCHLWSTTIVSPDCDALSIHDERLEYSYRQSRKQRYHQPFVFYLCSIKTKYHLFGTQAPLIPTIQQQLANAGLPLPTMSSIA